MRVAIAIAGKYSSNVEELMFTNISLVVRSTKIKQHLISINPKKLYNPFIEYFETWSVPNTPYQHHQQQAGIMHFLLTDPNLFNTLTATVLGHWCLLHDIYLTKT